MGLFTMKGKMSRLQRAKQFMPFAALKGFETLLAAVARPTEMRVELSEDQLEELIARYSLWWRGILYEYSIIQVIVIQSY